MAYAQLLVRMVYYLETIRRNFFWGHDKDMMKTHYFSWHKASLPFHSEGYGVKNFQIFNYAMLGKIAWELMLVEDRVDQEISPWYFQMKKNTSQIQVSY